MKFYPDILTFADGRAVTPENFSEHRAEMLDILRKNAYGYFPPAPEKVRGEIEYSNDSTCSGHARAAKVTISFDTPKGEFSFPVNYFEPTGEGKKPLILLINFRPDRYDKYYPAEEIIDNGFAVAAVHYGDITSDDGDFSDGLAGMFDRPTDGTGFGKITLWAYGLSRMVDFFSTLDNIDTDNIGVIGHSRLGKTALWCGANDERIKYICSNDSGCMGAAYNRTRHEGGETIEIITRVFPFWFCENLFAYKENIEGLPFDQHYLIGASAPRYVCVNSATQDTWADPYSEQLACAGASPLWELLGKKGFAEGEKQAENGDCLNSGDIAYNLRDGVHFLGRTDWNNFMKFIKSKM